MDKFLEAFKEALELDRDISMDDAFRDYDEWDSLARLSLIAMLDMEYDVQIESDKFDNLLTVRDLFNAATGA